MKTHFRKTLIEELSTILSPDKLEEFQTKNPFLNAKEELLCELAEYYNKKLLSYSYFAKEFSQEELKAIAAMNNKLQKLTPVDWKQVQLEAKKLLSVLQSRSS